MDDPGSRLKTLYIFFELSDRFSRSLDSRFLYVAGCASVGLSFNIIVIIVERRLYRRIHIIIKRRIIQGRRIVEGRHVCIDFEHVSIDESSFLGFLFFLFLLCLEQIDKAHRAAAVSRRSHLGIEFFLIDAAGRCPRRLYVRYLSLARLVNYSAPVKGDTPSCRCRLFFRAPDDTRVELRFLESGIAAESELLPCCILHPASACAAELRTVFKSVSAIATEQCITSSFIERPYGQELSFLHIKICLFTNIQ